MRGTVWESGRGRERGRVIQEESEENSVGERMRSRKRENDTGRE